ncbi:MAG: hypothetical protein KAJ19_26440 [Gammaproteobacteria bacterium]|nr:hypothetical protein [Gammaproteobacteria bacterium]
MRRLLLIKLLLLLTFPAWAEHFGYDTEGGSGLGVNNTWTYAVTWSADYYTASTGDVVDSLFVYISSANASGDSLKMAIYDVVDGQPENKIMETDMFLATNTVDWYGIAVNQALTNGTTYTLACGEFTAGNFSLRYDAETNAGSENGSTFPDIWTAGNSNWRFSMYAVYTPGGEDAPKYVRIRK